MEIITMILSGLALLAAILCLILILQEKKRNQKRNAALTDLLRAESDSVIAYVGQCRRDSKTEQAENFEHIKGIVDILQTLAPAMNAVVPVVADFKGRIENLEKGIVPDYNEALKAKESVDLFNEGLTGILGFDPLEIARKARQERTSGGRTE